MSSYLHTFPFGKKKRFLLLSIVCVQPSRGQRHQIALELELQNVVNCFMWVLGTVCTLNSELSLQSANIHKFKENLTVMMVKLTLGKV